MRAKKDPKTGKWYIRFRYTDWQGKRRETMKRGFETKREAEEWLRTFLAEQKADLNITFADFTEMYFKSISPRLRENTLRTKHYIIDLKIMPYFGAKKVTEITPANIIAWENELLAKGYSQTYMKTVYNQLLIDKETRGREIRWKKPKEPVNDREKWRNRAVCKRKEMQLNKKSAESGCQSLSALFCC